MPRCLTLLLLLLVCFACARPSVTAAQSKGKPTGDANSLLHATVRGAPVRDQRSPWEMLRNSQIYHTIDNNVRRILYVSRDMFSTILPQIVSPPVQERDPSPILQERAARTREKAEKKMNAVPPSGRGAHKQLHGHGRPSPGSKIIGGGDR